MSRRRSAIAAAASLVALGLAPLGMSLAHAADAACPSWSDPSGDARINSGDSSGATGDPDYDITAASIGGTDKALVGVIKVAALGAKGPSRGLGERFRISFTLGATTMYMYADRDTQALFDDVELVNLESGNTDPNGIGSAVYDTTKNTVTMTFPMAEVSAAYLAPAVGKPVSAVSAAAQLWTLGTVGASFDTAAGPTGQTGYVTGDSCAFGAGAPAPKAQESPVT